MKKPKKARNKTYRPRPVSQHGGLVAIAMCHARGENASLLKPDQVTDIGVAYWLSFENLRIGSANEEAWSCVACALNVALVLCEKGIGAEYVDALVTALDGCFRAKIRSEKTGNFRLDGEALRDIETALAIHDQQMEIAKRWEVTEAMQTIYKRLEEGNVYEVSA